MTPQPKPKPGKRKKQGHITNKPPAAGSVCFNCESQQQLETHEAFAGQGKRNLSIKYGMQVVLCNRCHGILTGIGGKGALELRTSIQQYAQRKFEETGSREEFMKRFIQNYL